MRRFYCGAEAGGRKSVSPIPLIKSVKMWQRSYFYVKNIAADGDWVNLPPFKADAPAGRLPNWSHRVKTLTPASAAAVSRL